MRQQILPAMLLVWATTGAQAASFTPLGSLVGPRPGFNYSYGNGISGDGSVVVGSSYSGNGAEAYRWTNASGMSGVGFLAGGGDESTARGVSADGSALVGSSDSASGSRAFYWTAESGMVKLGDGTGGDMISNALDVSANGSVAVGYRRVSGEPLDLAIEAFRWTATEGMIGLGDLPGRNVYSSASAVSADGTVIVGLGESASGREAFLWTSAGGMIGLGDLGGAGFQSEANGVSDDGTIVVGTGLAAGGLEAFRWTAADGMLALGFLCTPQNYYSAAFAISGDGSVVAGLSRGCDGIDQAVVWLPGSGIQRVFDVLVNNGASGLDGWTLNQVSDVSEDGMWLAGWGYNPLGQQEAFVANISPVPAPGSAWLFGTGLASLGGRRILRRKVAA